MDNRRNIIKDKSFQFALKTIQYCDKLTSLKKYVISKQMLKSGTSVGANIREAQQAESKLDFIHKLEIALKEVEETDYWLLLCQFSKNYPNPGELINKLNSVRHLIIAIIVSTKNNRGKSKQTQ